MALLLAILFFIYLSIPFIHCLQNQTPKELIHNVTETLHQRIQLIDISIRPRKCIGGPCQPTVPVPISNLNKYKLLSRLQEISYCDAALVRTWTCGLCSEKGSQVSNTTDSVSFSTQQKSVEGILGVSHDLKSIFIIFRGAQHNIQWLRSVQGKLVPLLYQNAFVNSSLLKTFKKKMGDPFGIKVHRMFFYSLKTFFFDFNLF